jgi:hypothetical protein
MQFIRRILLLQESDEKKVTLIYPRESNPINLRPQFIFNTAKKYNFKFRN